MSNELVIGGAGVDLLEQEGSSELGRNEDYFNEAREQSFSSKASLDEKAATSDSAKPLNFQAAKIASDLKAGRDLRKAQISTAREGLKPFEPFNVLDTSTYRIGERFSDGILSAAAQENEAAINAQTADYSAGAMQSLAIRAQRLLNKAAKAPTPDERQKLLNTARDLVTLTNSATSELVANNFTRDIVNQDRASAFADSSTLAIYGLNKAANLLAGAIGSHTGGIKGAFVFGTSYSLASNAAAYYIGRPLAKIITGEDSGDHQYF